MANTSAIWQQAAHTTYQLSSPSCSIRAIQKSLTLNEKYLSFLEKKSGGSTISRKMTRQKEQKDQAEKNKRGDRKGESNDSPEIPDRKLRSDIPDRQTDYTAHLTSSLHFNMVRISPTLSARYSPYVLPSFTHPVSQKLPLKPSRGWWQGPFLVLE